MADLLKKTHYSLQNFLKRHNFANNQNTYAYGSNSYKKARQETLYGGDKKDNRGLFRDSARNQGVAFRVFRTRRTDLGKRCRYTICARLFRQAIHSPYDGWDVYGFEEINWKGHRLGSRRFSSPRSSWFCWTRQNPDIWERKRETNNPRNPPSSTKILGGDGLGVLV